MKKVFVKTPQHTYTVYIKNELLKDVHSYLQKNKNYILISDDFIPKMYYETLTSQINIEHAYFIKAGEQSKSIDTAYSIIQKMLNDGVTKDYTLIALGGGVVGDLAGFIASIYMRGLTYVQIPTTLLAQVDSSVGGKTAVNAPTMKNAIGTYKHPSKVLIDPETLKTLDIRQFNNGMAEIIKYGLISNKTLYDELHANNINEHIDNVIATCVAIKAQIVYLDEKDQGVRQLLNYGHTIGHAIEQASKYTMLHGEAIAIGMRIMAKNQSFEDSLIQLLKQYHLPITHNFDHKLLLDIIKTDKKAHQDLLNIILVEEVGNGFVKTIKKDDIEHYLR
ncbi:MAG: 3-dehydroquinate synthase [Candidatus Izimaplasma sp.]|nr:3-dehydroquinate synthase [Candidatus Izimaplasma bacterium]